MNGDLSKPVGKDALLAAVTRFVQRDGAHEPATAAESA